MVRQPRQRGRRLPTERGYRHIGGRQGPAPVMNRVTVREPKDCSLMGCCASFRMQAPCAEDATMRGGSGQGVFVLWPSVACVVNRGRGAS